MARAGAGKEKKSAKSKLEPTQKTAVKKKAASAAAVKSKPKASAKEKKSAEPEKSARAQAAFQSVSKPRTLQMGVEHLSSRSNSNADKVVIHWKEADNDLGLEAYDVLQGALTDPANTIRHELTQLQHWGPDGDEDELRSILRRLAGAGERLYEALFSGVGSSATAAKKARAFFEKDVASAPPGSWRIQVEHASYSEAIIPWGFVFTKRKNSKTDSLDVDLDSWIDFWCLRFNLACRHSTLARGDKEVKLADNVRVAVVVENDKNIREYSNESARTPAEVARSEFQKDKIGSSKKGFEHLSETHRGRDVYWYLSLNENGGKYHIGQDVFRESDLKKEQDLKKQMRMKDQGERRDRVVFMLLDGDAVIRHDRGSKWVKDTLEFASSGLIAVEADIKNPKLRFFGWEVLKSILRNRRQFFMAVQEMRRAYWPYSLLYGVYCNPQHVWIDPPPEDDINDIDKFIEQQRGAEFPAIKARVSSGGDQ